MSLKKINYQYLLPVAGKDGSTECAVEGDVLDLLSNADPYNFLPLPPLRIINSFLYKGSNDLGMGGGASWAPLQLSETDYNELVDYLKSPEGKERFPYDGRIALVDVPENVCTMADLSVWKIDEALKDPDHHLNSDVKNARLADGRMVTFREYWEHEKSHKRNNAQS